MATASLVPPNTFPPTRFLRAGLAAGDINGDGHLDLVTCNWHDNAFYASGNILTHDGLPNVNGVSVLFGNGDGTFQAPRSFPMDGMPIAVACADLNGDGLDDVVTAGADGNRVEFGPVEGALSIRVGSSTGLSTLLSRTVDGMPDGPVGVTAGDTHQDQRLHLILGGGTSIQVLPGQ